MSAATVTSDGSPFSRENTPVGAPRLDVVVKHLMLLSLLLTGLSGISGAVRLTFVWIDEGKSRGGVEWLRRR